MCDPLPLHRVMPEVTKEQLVEHARAHGVDVTLGMNKRDIIAACRKSDIPLPKGVERDRWPGQVNV
jgi:hypothetical protein